MRSAWLSQYCWRARFFSSFCLTVKVRVEIDLRKFADQIGQHETRWDRPDSRRVAALLGEIRFLMFFIDGEKQLFFEGDQLFLARVLVERELGLIDSFAIFRVLHHAQQTFVARLAELDFEHEPACLLQVAFLDGLFRFGASRLQSIVCLRTSCSTSGLNLSY